MKCPKCGFEDVWLEINNDKYRVSNCEYCNNNWIGRMIYLIKKWWNNKL